MRKRSPRERTDALKPKASSAIAAAAPASKSRTPKRKYVLRVAAGILRKEEADGPRILITRRREGDSLAGYWEFPGGKLEIGETYPQALRRELIEEIGVETLIGGLYHTLSQDYPKKILHIRFYEASITGGALAAREVAEWQWVRPQELPNFRFPPADRPLIKKLQFSKNREREQSQ